MIYSDTVYQLQEFYNEVHKCIKGRGKGVLAWDIIKLAIHSTQDDGHFSFVFDQEEFPKITLDEDKLNKVLEKFGFDEMSIEDNSPQSILT